MLTRITLLLTLPAAIAAGIDLKSLQSQGYVSDFAGVIGAAERARMEEYAKSLERSTGMQAAVVTLASLDGQPIEDFAHDLYNHWGIGKKGADEGVLILLSVRERRFRMEVGRGLEPLVPDGFAGSVLRAMRPALREQHYGDALETGLHALGQRVAEKKGVAVRAPAAGGGGRRQRPRESPLPWPVVAGGAALLLWGMSSARRSYSRGYGRGGGVVGAMLPGMLMGGLMDSGRHRGGGFGGYDSSGGFGGFGGGASGGGGASSDW